MISLNSSIYNSIEKIDNILIGTTLDHYQVSSGTIRCKIEHIHIGNDAVGIGQVSNDALSVGKIDEGKIIFVIMMDEGSGKNIFNGQPVFKDTLFCFGSGTEISYRQAAGSMYMYLITSKEKLKSLGYDYASIVGGYRHHMHDTSSKIKTLIRQIKFLKKTQLAWISEEVLYENFLMIFFNDLKNRYSVCRLDERSSPVAFKLYQYIIEHSNHPIMMHDLCRIVKKSERSLQRIFKKIYHITLQQFIKIRRLHQARQQLLYNVKKENITNIAFGIGFNHMSRFAGEYKTFFGELPSSTRPDTT